MAEKPLTPEERAKLGAFLASLLSGAADLGISSLPLVALYARARKEGIPVMDLALSDPVAVEGVLKAIERQAPRLPQSVITTLEHVARVARGGS